MPRAPHLTWTKGGDASFVSLQGEAVVVRSSTPAPPGARLEGTLTTALPRPVKIKSHGSKREDDGQFVIRGRLVDATRETREAIAALLPSAEGAITPSADGASAAATDAVAFPKGVATDRDEG